jgi:hypothetical protein
MSWGFNRVIKLPIFFGILILETKVDLRPQRVNARETGPALMSYQLVQAKSPADFT